ncbi:4-hydroxy-tetrahydrodipicolinate synthase [Daejeonella rubra]|uniref:4-hydroxy-tetrahydrodipicolinate synthase n=1 Tax=Daejeonella rubra TaxID=990371 RepID=A0A1G9MRS0_9SPHI|nr:4-hydroxy-tetrahydrodipicolinate synthase [Daejeonella rubra]SDL76958.1 4-hydroxy-tetrahydrodipicolinate synthase [Daejeonella rubra]
MNKFHGTGVAIITPFKSDGSVDHTALKTVIDHIINGGAEYIVSLGTTGEAATLDSDEKKAVWETTVSHVNGRVSLVAGIGGNNTSEVLKDLKKFDSNGFDAVLSVCPYYNKPTQEGIYQHYKAVADNSSLPIILYNVPGRTGVNMTAETTLRLAHDHKNIIAMKEASGNFEQFNKIIKDKPEDFLFISGDDPITLPLIAMGAAGVISVIGNALPGIFSTMVRMCLDGKFIEAQPLHHSLTEITSLCFVEGNPGGVKSAMKLLGICGDTMRLPLVNISEGTENQIRAKLEQLNLL